MMSPATKPLVTVGIEDVRGEAGDQQIGVLRRHVPHPEGVTGIGPAAGQLLEVFNRHQHESRVYCAP